jgi:hypothetical protein
MNISTKVNAISRIAFFLLQKNPESQKQMRKRRVAANT